MSARSRPQTRQTCSILSMKENVRLRRVRLYAYPNTRLSFTDSDRIAEYDMKLMDIDSDQLGIPETEYDARVTMSSSEFARIVRDLSQLGESVRIEVSKEGIRFASDGEAANGSVLLKQTGGGPIGKVQQKIKEDEDADDDAADDDAEEEEDEDGVKVKKEKKAAKVKKEKGDEDVDMDDEEKDTEEFKPGSDEEGEDEAAAEDSDDEESGKKRKKKVRHLISYRRNPSSHFS